MNIGVVGLGLVGGSIAKKLLDVQDNPVFGFDVLPGACALAENEGVLVIHPEEMAERCDLVVVATSARAAVEEIEKLLLFGSPAVIDVASVKQPVIDGLAHLPDDLQARFLATHPMAGAQTSGFQSSRRDLFDFCTWAVSGNPGLEVFLLFARLASYFNAAIVPIDAKEHDRAVARSSHLVQLLHTAVAAQLADASGSELLLSGPALRDSTRLAESPYDGFWHEVFQENKSFIEEAKQELIAELTKDDGVTKDLWRHGAIGRERLLSLRWSDMRWREYSVPISSWWSDLLLLGQGGVAIKDPRAEEFLLLFQRSF